MNEEDVEILTILKLDVNRALWGEVIPSLRRVRLEWNPGDKTAWIIFYHDGAITPNIEDHYGCIYAETGTEAIEPNIDFKIIRCDYPKPVPNEKYVIYARKEPFVDPL